MSKPTIDAIVDELQSGQTLASIVESVNQRCEISPKADPEWRVTHQDRMHPLRSIIAALHRNGFKLKKQKDEKGTKDEYVYVRLNDEE